MAPQRRAAWYASSVCSGRTSPEQDAWHQQLREQGYSVHLAYGWDQAMVIIVDYLS